jgi:tRNA(Ile)-lysidine synthase
MLTKLKAHIEKNKLFRAQDRLLLAVSGGVDSMVLAELLLQLRFEFTMAHVNFGLRGKEADLDADFVNKWGEDHRIPVLVKKVETAAFAKEHQVSIQMAARTLRYQWFDELMEIEAFSALLTAHHADDNLETVLFNLTKGTGIRGLSGMKNKHLKRVRPLLIFAKEELVQYAEKHEIRWREDASNETNKYARNKIRNKVLPSLKEINPALLTTFQTTLTRLSGLEFLLDEKLKSLRKGYFTPGVIDQLDTSWIRQNEGHQVLLYEILVVYGLNYAQFKQIFESVIMRRSGMFYWDDYTLNVDRNKIFVAKGPRVPIDQYMIEMNVDNFQFSGISFEIQDQNTQDGITNEANVAYLDLEKLSFPLCLRKWKTGDFFYPLGMQQRKKVSDFLVDLKIPRMMKENVLVLESKGMICWIVGKRIDQRFSIQLETQKGIRIKATSVL